MALSMIERMRARTAAVAATTKIAVAQPIKAIGGEERIDDGVHLAGVDQVSSRY